MVRVTLAGLRDVEERTVLSIAGEHRVGYRLAKPGGEELADGKPIRRVRPSAPRIVG